MRTMIRLGLALLVGAPLVASTTAAGAAGEHGGVRDFEEVWDAATPQQRTAAADLIVDTADATERWQDVDAAIADGFRPNHRGLGPVHYRNAANRRDDRTLDPSHPETLVYLHRANGAPVLLGAVYVTMPSQERKVPGGDITAWHVHHDPSCHHPDVDGGCEDVRGGMLHVWLYDGVVDPFADPMPASMGGRAQWRAKLADIARSDPPAT